LGSWDVFAHGWEATFVLLRAFSPVIKSLNVELYYVSFQHFFDFALSFPLLEDLSVNGHHDVPVDNNGDSDGLSAIEQTSSSPVLTGTLELVLGAGMGPIVHRMLSIPNGVHFRKLTLKWFSEGNIPLTMVLVEKCSRALESLWISCYAAFGTSLDHLHPRESNSCCW